MKKSLTCFAALAVLSAAFINQTAAQGIKRQCIGSYGSGSVTERTFIGQTIGQPYSTVTYNDGKVRFSPGFQQGIFFSLRMPDLLPVQKNLNIFPNPSSGSIFVSPAENIENAVVQVSDVNGRVVLKESVSDFQNYHIDCSRLRNGIYFVTIYNGNRFHSNSKLIISK